MATNRISDEMVIAAIKSMVELGLVPRSVAMDNKLKYFNGMRQVLNTVQQTAERSNIKVILC